jgi:hypothetical protein
VISRSRYESGGWRVWRDMIERLLSAVSLRCEYFLERKMQVLLEHAVLQVVRPSLPMRIDSKYIL